MAASFIWVGGIQAQDDPKGPIQIVIPYGAAKDTGTVVTGTGILKGSCLRLWSERIGTVEGINTYPRTGDHRPEGLFVAAGPGIPVRHLERTTSIIDFAPTFEKLLDVSIPPQDGQAIPGIS
jgi:hypothetical protein